MRQARIQPMQSRATEYSGEAERSALIDSRTVTPYCQQCGAGVVSANRKVMRKIVFSNATVFTVYWVQITGIAKVQQNTEQLWLHDMTLAV